MLMGLAYDPAEAVAQLSKADKQLAKVIRRVGPLGITPQRMEDTFQTLLRAIIYQQLSGKAAATIHGRVVAAFGEKGKKITPHHLITVADDELRAVGMSRAKVAAAKDLAAKTLDGTVPPVPKLRRLSDAEIVERLTSVRGIGVWTVEMLLLFRLGRPDVLPVSDLGVRKGFMLTYGHEELPKPAAILAHGERWRPFRSAASWYLWRACDLEKKPAAKQK